MENYFSLRMRQVSANVRRQRQRRHISQEELARTIGCSRTRIANMEAGHGSYLAPELEIIAKFMGMDIDDLTPMSPAEEGLLSKYLESQGRILNLRRETSWLEKEISESGIALKRIFQTIYRALPALNGTLAYSIIQPDSFVADYLIQRFEKKGKRLKVLDLKEHHLIGLRAFLAFLLNQENRRNMETERLAMMTKLDKRRYLVILDHAENASEQVLRWILDQTQSQQENQAQQKRNNYWLFIRDDVKFKNTLFKMNKFPFEYAKQKIIHIPLELVIDAH